MNTNAPQVDELFELDQYKHKALFESSNMAWLVLNQLKDYLLSLSLGHNEGIVSPKAHLVNPELISIGPGSVIEPNVYIEGPCIIGKNCQVRHGAYIRGNVLTGDSCVIGHATEIKNSVLLNGSQAAHFAYVGDSIIGNKVNLGAGVKLANLLFSNKNVLIVCENIKIDSTRRKLGAILGDHSQVGCNSVTNPGTILGKRACVYPCLNVGGVISTNSIVKSSAETVSSDPSSYVHT